MPVIAALSAAHLAALIWPPELHRLYVARDNDEAGRFALEKLRSRATEIDIRELVPRAEDFNADRKSTRLNPVTNAHLVCRLLLEKKKTYTAQYETPHLIVDTDEQT